MTEAPILFNRLCVIGIGLIGSSILWASRERGLATTLVAADVSKAVRARVRELGMADEVTGDVAQAVRGAECVILCVPSGSFGAVAKAIGTDRKSVV